MKVQIHLLCLVLGLLALPFVGHTAPLITALHHTPLHAANNAAVTFRVVASSPTGIKRVRLTLVEYECFLDDAGQRASRPRHGGARQEIATWVYQPADYPRSIERTAAVAAGFPKHSLVRYTVDVEDQAGTSTQTVSMQAGDSPFGAQPILLYTASQDPPEQTFEVCFIPDTKDFGNRLSQFRTALEATIYRGYLGNAMINDHREEWAFYYTTTTRDFKKRNIPRDAKGLDAYCFLHTRRVRDASSGRTFSSEAASIGTVVHETGHAVLNLNDEYSGKGATGGCNVFRSAQACQDANGGQACRRFTVDGTAAYTPEPLTPTCIMRSDGDEEIRQFQAHCQRCIEARYAELNRRTPVTAFVHADSSVALFRTEKVIPFRLDVANNRWIVSVLPPEFGKLPLSSTGGADPLEVNALNAGGQVLFSVTITDPRVEVVHTEDGTSRTYAPSGMAYVLLPFDSRIAALQLKGTTTEKRAFIRPFNVAPIVKRITRQR